ncbi:MAG TPA: glutamate synthase large subunit [Terriglobia bacterium]|nr:glutamate synthase large subunit [Terriglobia bacterium]
MADERPRGLNQRDEHDACGVGFVADLNAPASHRVVTQALECLACLTHRGGADADGASGDGAGIAVQLPSDFFAREARRLNSGFQPHWRTAVGVFFFPSDGVARARAMFAAEEAVRNRGLYVAGWRQVPVNPDALGPQARESQPAIWHLLVAQPADQEREFEQILYLTRKEIERRIAEAKLADCYIPSFSSRNIVYKGLMAPSQLGIFYKDLGDSEFKTSAALYHQRYSTNTSPTWFLAQPFRLVAHNGEINTLLGNRNWMRAREAVLDHPIWGNESEWLKPVIQPGGSDSASFDNVLELLTRSGRAVHHALLMMIPEAWEGSVEIPADVQAFYHYHSCLMEPWDGPAAMAFLDGPLVGAALDRNGLRPARYTITRDGLVVLGSEVGVLPIEPERVQEKGRLGPGQILLVDLEHKKVFKNEQLKKQVSHARKYRKWIRNQMLFLPRFKAEQSGLAEAAADRLASTDRASFIALQRAAGYTEEDLELLIKPLAGMKKEPVGSMGDDTPLAALSTRPRPVYHYFRQMFAQVTNPPIDPLRESLVMALNLYLGARHSVLIESPEHARMMRLESPFLFDAELAELKQLGEEKLKPVTVSVLFPANQGPDGMTAAIERIREECLAAVKQGSSILILSDRGVDAGHAAVPMLLVVGAVVEHLIAEGVGNKADLVLETAEAWESHQFACLVAYGAAGINAYLALEAVADLAGRGELGQISVAQALENFRSGIETGIKKIMSKMGISTLASYQGGKFFEIIGLDQDVVKEFFPDTRSLIGGRKLVDLAHDVIARHGEAFPAVSGKPEFAGYYRFRKGFERHAFSPQVIRNLQKAAKEDDAESYKAFAREVDEREPITLRDLLKFVPAKPIPLEEVEPVEAIWKRFTSQAMSLGALSPETQHTLAVAMNRIGARSNTGEGGEDSNVYFIELENGDSAENKIKQVASARFGVTPEYLVRAEQLEIKMAQGSKPGEGGQLPSHKVTPMIARVRRAVEGISLISPPPHHDIYSIEDLAQLIYDLREINPSATIAVKLVSQAGVGTVASGVAKANADVVLISGHDGGTGASPLISVKNTGSPWEMGLSEAHQCLVENGLRSRVRLRADGGLKTGKDVVVAAMLGADEFGFGTSALVALACVMARQCHLNTCPVGVATQREDLRKKFPNEPERLVNYLRHVAQNVRELLAQLGFRSLEEIVGRTDLLVTTGRKIEGRRGQLDLRPLLHRPDPEIRSSVRARTPARNLDPLALRMAEDVKQALDSGVSIVREYAIRNINRTIGARAANVIALRFGNRGMQGQTAEFRFTGSAGQSFGAFLTEGLRLVLDGEANDYVGKGLGGGEVIIRPPKECVFASNENVIMGNAVLYGATAGKLFAAGRAGERFAVRNSGATAVVEGAGDHACEYMTGGVVVILGETGRNFGAGMTNGLAFVFDSADRFEQRYNPELVKIERVIEPGDSHLLRELVMAHAEKTGSQPATDILENWAVSLLSFWKVQPRSVPASAPAEAIPRSSNQPAQV